MIKNSTDLTLQATTDLADNTDGSITAQDIRDMITNLIESTVNVFGANMQHDAEIKSNTNGKASVKFWKDTSDSDEEKVLVTSDGGTGAEGHVLVAHDIAEVGYGQTQTRVTDKKITDRLYNGTTIVDNIIQDASDGTPRTILKQVQIYADEAAAAAAGLQSKEVYMTATGDLRIKL